MIEVWKDAEKQLRKEVGNKDAQYQVVISQAIKQLIERFDADFLAKEQELIAVNLDKNILEATVLRMKDEIQVRSAELEAASKARELEKDELLSQIVAAKKETVEIIRGSKMAVEALNAENNMLSRLAELQTNLAFMASENRSLIERNRELTTEEKTLKAQLNEYNEKLFCVQQEMDENVKQYNVAEMCLKQQNQILHKEVHSTRCLLQTEKVQDRTVENDSLKNQVEELSKKVIDLTVTHVYIMQVRDRRRKEFESLHAEAVKKYKIMEEKHSELLKEKEEEAKTIMSLRGEIASLINDKSSPSQIHSILNEATKKYAKI